LRLAKSPGNYTFLVHSWVGADSSFVVKIENDMLTPVKIAIADKWINEGNEGWEKYVIYLDALREKEVLYSEYINKKENPGSYAPVSKSIAPIPLPESPRGYVEFYLPQGKAPHYDSYVYSLVDNQEIFEKGIYSKQIGADKVYLRLTKIPGVHTFSIHMIYGDTIRNTYRYTFPVQIETNMVTPVKITFPYAIKASKDFWIFSDIAFNVHVEVEKPVPYVETESY